jgi:hypothetical protein
MPCTYQTNFLYQTNRLFSCIPFQELFHAFLCQKPSDNPIFRDDIRENA